MPRSPDPNLDPQARRLFLSAALSTHALRRSGGRIAPESDAEDLLALARRLGEEIGPVETRYRLRFEPAYPGVTAGPQSVKSGLRLTLACGARGDGDPLGVAFTVLIPGRPPQVSVAPTGARIPEGWRPLADLP